MNHAKAYSRREALIALSALAASSAVPTLASAQTLNYPLWEITSGAGKVYLLAHTPPRRRTWSDPRIEQLLRGCRVLWTETQHRDEPPSQELIKRYVMDTSGTLQRRLTARDRERLIASAKAARVPLGSLDALQPWAAGETLESSFFEEIGPTQNAAQVLYAKATAAGIATSSEFAAAGDVMRWFAALSEDVQVEYLRYIMDEVLQGTSAGQRIYEAWAIGDSGPADAWVARMKATYPNLYPSIVLERNRAWVSRITSMLTKKKPSMVVVGLYHLAGPDRLQSLLAQSGLTIRRG